MFILAGIILAKIQYWFRSDIDPWSGKESGYLARLFFRGFIDFASWWNDYEIHGIDELYKNPKNCLLVGYHSRCTLDLLYFFFNSRCKVLCSYLFFKVPLMKYIWPTLGMLPSSDNKSSKKLSAKSEDGFIKALAYGDRPLILVPGGINEVFKTYQERFKPHWKEEPGFARVIVENKELLGTKTRVIPFYTKNCEDSLYINEWWHDFSGRHLKKMYESFKGGNLMSLPILMIFGQLTLGFIFLPPPVKLDTYFAEPVVWKEGETSKAFAERVEKSLQELINKVESGKLANNTVKKRRWEKSWINKLALIALGGWTFFQNTSFFMISNLLTLWLYVPITVYTISKQFFPKREEEVKLTKKSL